MKMCSCSDRCESKSMVTQGRWFAVEVMYVFHADPLSCKRKGVLQVMVLNGRFRCLRHTR